MIDDEYGRRDGHPDLFYGGFIEMDGIVRFDSEMAWRLVSEEGRPVSYLDVASSREERKRETACSRRRYFQ